VLGKVSEDGNHVDWRKVQESGQCSLCWTYWYRPAWNFWDYNIL